MAWQPVIPTRSPCLIGHDFDKRAVRERPTLIEEYDIAARRKRLMGLHDNLTGRKGTT